MNLDRYYPFDSQHIPARNVEVWLPPSYTVDGEIRYPVIYMHDGQNLFEPEKAFIGVDWGIDQTLIGLIGHGEVPPPIVVGIWNTSNRLGEYMPEAALPNERARSEMAQFVRNFRDASEYYLCGDAYLKFIVEELKPFIDSRYPTRPDQNNTYLMGSSMGGLISLYGLCRYPEVFGGAACLSNAWNFGRGMLLPYFENTLPDPASHKIYLDMGGKEIRFGLLANRRLVSLHRQAVDYAKTAGYQDGDNLLTMTFPNDEHSERSWRKRIHIPLRFLLTGSPG
jgi:predicted alpha/beta superfamily hydrolase